MDAPSFEGLLLALFDADARGQDRGAHTERYTDDLRSPHRRGFLSGSGVSLSPNLIAYNRRVGTGKSTVFEAIRCITGTRRK